MTYSFRKHFWVLLLTLVLLWPQSIFAADPPKPVAPADNTIESKPKLIWEYSGGCVEIGSCFRVEVDNASDFSSPEKSTYTNNFTYSPQGLNEGSWYWRVRAKDKTDTWSDWSKVFKFTIGTVSDTASSPASADSKSTPTPSVSSAKQENIFTIKDVPAEINSDQESEVSVSIKLPDKPDTKFYLKGAFKKSDSSNYFGYTYSGDEWSKNGSSYSAQLKIETNSEGNWEGKIKVRPDPDDSGFNGSGSYIFKVGRYTDSGNGPVWSNEISLKINAVSTPEPSVMEEPEEKIEEEPEEIDLSGSIIKTATAKNYEIKIASVAGEATMSNNITLEEQTRVLEEKKVNWLLIMLGSGILFGGIGYIIYKIRTEKN